MSADSMPTERMEEVEVVVPCESCGGDLSRGCAFLCDGKGTKRWAKVPEGSLTAARLRLADAAEAWLKSGVWSAEVPFALAMANAEAEKRKVHEAFDALAALRTARGEG